jgi:hypothetical protein
VAEVTPGAWTAPAGAPARRREPDPRLHLPPGTARRRRGPRRIDGGPGNDSIDGADYVDDNQIPSVIKGGLGNDGISGRSGRDKILGLKGDDALRGLDGNHRLDGGIGDDDLDGGNGTDTCVQGPGTGARVACEL